jgi:subtilase family serine protease
MVPAALGGIVQSVLGLQNAFRMQTQQSSNPMAATISPGFTSEALRKAYNVGSTPDGSGTTVGIIAAGDDLSVVRADLEQSRRVQQLPYIPTEVVQAAPLPNPQDNSGDGEWDLDGQSSSSIAGNLQKIIYYNATDLADSLALAYTAFADENRAKALNVSLGGCEFLSGALGTLAAEDVPFMKAQAQGQTVFVSTGDAGAACGVAVNLTDPDSGIPSQVEYPSSSAYVVAVGGTSLMTDSDHNYANEISWAAGGGGISNFEKAPSWQSAAGVPSAMTTGMRGTPDISMDAGLDINAEEAAPVFASAFYTYSGGLLYRSIGTSLSSPLSMGVWARMQSARCNGLGFAAPLIYALDTAGGPGSTATGFTDITVGTNGEYVATPGWDYTTGFGTWDITAANAALPKKACEANQLPTASLSAPAFAGNAPFTLALDASGSSDPDGTLAYYAVDYDDQTPVVIQTAPVFAPHTYAKPGLYTVTLSVRDAKGGTSSTVSQVVSVAGMPDACTLPGQRIVTAAAGTSGLAGGQDPFSGQDDLLWTNIAEPASQPGKLVVTMKVNNLSSLPTGMHWVTYFTKRGDAFFDHFYFVQMSSDGSGPSYSYGTRGFVPGGGYRALNVLGALDAASTYKADGTITLVLDKSAIGLATGDHLENIASYTALGAPDLVAQAGVPVPVVQNLDLGGTYYSYPLIGNDLCAKGVVVSTTGTATGTGTGTGTTGTGTGTTGTGTGTTGTGTGTGTPTTTTSTGSSKASTGEGRFGGGALGAALLLPGLLLGARKRRLRR